MASTAPPTTTTGGGTVERYLTKEHFASLVRQHAVTISATSAAITCVFIGFPFDSIKTRMQAFRYPSTIACVRQTYNAEGIAGFFRGVVPVATSVAVLRSISFSLYNSGKSEIKGFLPSGMDPLTAIMIQSSLSGSFSGMVLATLNAPIEFIKVQKQLERLSFTPSNAAATKIAEEAIKSVPTAAAGLGEGATTVDPKSVAESTRRPSHGSSHGSSSTQPPKTSSTPIISRPSPPSTPASSPQTTKSTAQWAKHIVVLKGPQGLYSGFPMHLLRDALGTGMYFCGYETVKHLMTPTGATAGPLTHMLAGGLAGTCSWVVLFPIDITKSVIQREALHDQPKYKSSLHFIRARWAKQGIRGFYVGIGPQLLRSFPVHSINFLVYEQMLAWCRGFNS
ncbi:mitochondrial carrier domain-containing protein [Fimicolochytrium jonesii]|uniref:mitochondrial carrier domain-containing protein n=1 Tax=Fimicolochytrium jonesii TaxID=1396493 RepID=UPI0022FF3944|nr:mitochondrial carrier domain-containing protein [Fimicolochytrium jonesii]KAI8820456.1 mitochondrial carrier domain-containing protein [Fimicolochytrium jonesii]